MGIDDAARLLDRYRALLVKVDEHASRIGATYPDHVACRPGCAGCCRGGLTVSPIEAAAIAAGPEPSGPSKGARILTVLDEGRDDCAHLDGAGRCRIYGVRPLVCRTHGLPLVFAQGSDMVADVCPLNFEDGLNDLPAADFLNQDTVHTVLAALNQAWCAAMGADPRDRVLLEPTR